MGYKVFVYLHVLTVVQKNAVRGRAVPSRASRLLIITFDILGHVVMNHIRHVRLVYPHTESVGRHHYCLSVVNKIFLILFALLVAKTGVITGGVKTAVKQKPAGFVHGFSCGAINNSACLFSFVKTFQKRGLFVFRLLHLKIKIMPVKAGVYGQRIAQSQ